MIKIKIKRITENAILPKKMTKYAAGYDLYSTNEKDIILPAKEVDIIPTGIAISLPQDYEAQVRPRSGLAIKSKIGILNSPGTIDADYRGEIKVILFNFGKEDFIIKPNMRIAQMVISKIIDSSFEISEELDETERGSGGFGHTKLI